MFILLGHITSLYIQVKLSVEDVKNGKAQVLDADVCLVAIGRRPYTQGLGLEELGIPVDRIGRVEVRPREERKREREFCF